MIWDSERIKHYKKFFTELVEIMEKKVPYADVLLIKTNSTVVQKDKNTTDIDKIQDLGVKLRVFNGESFFEFGSSNLDEELLKAKAKELSKVKVFKKSKRKAEKRFVKDFKVKGKIDPLKVSLKKKVSVCEKAFNKITKFDKRIVNVKVFYKDTTDLRIFVSRSKALSQTIVRCNHYFFPFMKSKDGVRTHFMSKFAPGFEVTEISDAEIKKFCELCVKIIGAERIKPGKHDCILGGKAAGLLAHESFGHGMEADTIYKDRAKAKSFVGKRIAPSKVSIVDFPGMKSHGYYFFDDEGQPVVPTYLIKNGIVKDPMTDMYSAMKLKIKRSGNGRCQSYDHKSYSRMSCTYFLPGKDDLNKMFKSVKNGIYIFSGGGGMEDPKGWGVQIQSCLGEEIKNGKLTGKLFYELAIGGYLPDIFSNIKAVSKKMNPYNAGYCGKGHKEWVPVAEGGPHLLIKRLLLS